jgi:hypothetical protein
MNGFALSIPHDERAPPLHDFRNRKSTKRILLGPTSVYIYIRMYSSALKLKKDFALIVSDPFFLLPPIPCVRKYERFERVFQCFQKIEPDFRVSVEPIVCDWYDFS